MGLSGICLVWDDDHGPVSMTVSHKCMACLNHLSLPPSHPRLPLFPFHEGWWGLWDCLQTLRQMPVGRCNFLLVESDIHLSVYMVSKKLSNIMACLSGVMVRVGLGRGFDRPRGSRMSLPLPVPARRQGMRETSNGAAPATVTGPSFHASQLLPKGFCRCTTLCHPPPPPPAVPLS